MALEGLVVGMFSGGCCAGGAGIALLVREKRIARARLLPPMAAAVAHVPVPADEPILAQYQIPPVVAEPPAPADLQQLPAVPPALPAEPPLLGADLEIAQPAPHEELVWVEPLPPAPDIVVCADVNMAKIYVAMECKLGRDGRAEDAREINRLNRGGVQKFGAALGALVGGFDNPSGRLNFNGYNGIRIMGLDPVQYALVNQILQRDLWYISRRDAGQIYSRALALELTEAEQDVLTIQACPVIGPGAETRSRRARAYAPNAYEMQSSDKILVAANAVLRAAEFPPLQTEETHFRGRNGYIFAVSLDDERRRYLLEQMGPTDTEQTGLQLPEDVPQNPPPEPPCTNETCIICCDGSIRSAMNPEGCRHAFCCDACLERLPRCAMCQAPKHGYLPFALLHPPISQEHPVYHAIMGDLHSFMVGP